MKQHAQVIEKGNGTLTCMTLILSSGEVIPQNAVLSFGPLATRKRGHGICSGKAKEAVKGLEHKWYGKQLRELQLLNLQKRGLRVDLVAPYSSLKGVCS